MVCYDMLIFTVRYRHRCLPVSAVLFRSGASRSSLGRCVKRKKLVCLVHVSASPCLSTATRLVESARTQAMRHLNMALHLYRRSGLMLKSPPRHLPPHTLFSSYSEAPSTPLRSLAGDLNHRLIQIVCATVTKYHFRPPQCSTPSTSGTSSLASSAC